MRVLINYVFLFVFFTISLGAETKFFRKVSSDRAYFHTKPYASAKRDSYLIKGQEFVVYKTRTAFLYTEYINEKGKISKGWISETDVYLYEIVAVENVGKYAGTSFSYIKLKYYPDKRVLDWMNRQFHRLTVIAAKNLILDEEIRKSLRTKKLEKISQFLENYNHGKEENSIPTKFFYKISQEVPLLKKNILVLKLTKLVNKEDGNPQKFTRYINYNMKTGKPLSLQELFPDHFEVELKLNAIEYIRKHFSDKKILQAIDNRKFKLPDNFFIDHKGIGFHYNKGDYSSDYDEELQFIIPFSELQNLILLSGPIGWTVYPKLHTIKK